MKPIAGFLSPVESQLLGDGRLERGGRAVERLIRGERIIISRALCHFERITRPPGGLNPKTIQAARLAASARTPFRDAGFYLSWGRTHIGVWSWPKALLSALAERDYTAIPETVLHSSADGLALRACLDGYEGQYWYNGELVASRWWASQPEESDWDTFVRALPDAIYEPLPRPARPLHVGPSSSALITLLDMARRPDPRDLGAIALILVAAPLLYLGGQWISLDGRINAAGEALAQLQRATAEVVEARASVQAARLEMDAYRDALASPHPAEMMAVFAEAAAEADTQLDRALITDRRLEIVLRSTETVSAAGLVEMLEAHPRLSEVRFAPLGQQNLWRIEAAVNGETQ